MTTGTAADKAYEHIRQKILSLDLLPGASINETSLTEELQTSRAPIREALKRLDQENLVTILPRKGTFVSQVSLADFHEIFELRMELEGFAAYLAAERASKHTFAQLEELFRDAEVRASAATNDNEIDLEIDSRFHRIVYSGAANKYLQQTLEALLNHSIRLFNLSRTRSASVTEEIPNYRTLYECLKKRDASGARRWMQQHIVDSKERVEASFTTTTYNFTP